MKEPAWFAGLSLHPESHSYMKECCGSAFTRPCPFTDVKATSKSCLEDFPVHQGIVWNQWRQRKMSDEECYRDLVRCRDPRAPQALAAFEYLRKKETIQNLQDEIARVQEELRLLQRPFKQHPTITKWEDQFLPKTYGTVPRSKPLVLVGGSQQGKTSRAMAIFGISKTFKVSCQSCPNGVLPSLSGFVRGKHVAILFDEIRSDQVLLNREFFQSSQFPQTMSQSACNQYAYEVWVYHIAMILCANKLEMTEEDGLSVSDADWMQSNIIEVMLPVGHTWYLKADESAAPPIST